VEQEQRPSCIQRLITAAYMLSHTPAFIHDEAYYAVVPEPLLSRVVAPAQWRDGRHVHHRYSSRPACQRVPRESRWWHRAVQIERQAR